MTLDYTLLFLIGFTGSAHCMGMCGPFALHISSSNNTPLTRTLSVLIFQIGKLFTYAFLGAVVSIVGMASASSGAIAGIQQVLGITAGALMLLLGLQLLGVLGSWGGGGKIPGVGFLIDLIRPVLLRPGGAPAFVVGLFAGFLPCGLVWAALARAVVSETLHGGMLTMIAFGVGTVPAITLVGITGAVVSATWRARVYRLSGIFMIVMGVVTTVRAVPALHTFFHSGMDHSAQEVNMHQQHH